MSATSRQIGEIQATELLPHYTPKDPGDRAAYALVKFFRVFADLLFQKRYGHRAVVLVVRADEARHRDTNHGFADDLAGTPHSMPKHLNLGENS